jgi:hypothetical protein
LTRRNACLQFSSSQTSSISRSVPARLSDWRFSTSVSVPFLDGLRSITPTLRREGQLSLFGLVFLPLSAHESRRLLALLFTPLAGYRSGLRSSFPARPIRCSAFRPWSASISSPTARPTTPFADFCNTIGINRFTLSHDSVTCHRPPEVSSTAFDAQPPDLPPVSLMDMGFAINGPLAPYRRPRIRFLFIGSRLCSTLLSDPASRRVLFHPCASL